MMKDADQKSRLYRHLRAHRWYALTEVLMAPPVSATERSVHITDIDVLGVRASPDLRWELLLGDCKTLKGTSPVNRAIWLSGLMQHLGAVRGYIILQRRNQIEADHKMFAADLGIALLDEDELEQYDRALLYPERSATSEYEPATYLDALFEVRKKYPALAPLTDFLRGPAWTEADHFSLLRQLIAVGRDVRGEIDPNKPEHVALALEACAIFAVPLATCIGTMFHQHLQPDDRATLDRALLYRVWGGSARYHVIAQLRQKLAPEAADDLSLPGWSQFLQLVRSGLDAPRLAFESPHTLRLAAVDALSHAPKHLLSATPGAGIKLAMQAASYYVAACTWPAQLREQIRTQFADAF